MSIGQHRVPQLDVERTIHWGKVAVLGRAASAVEICTSATDYDFVVLANFRDADLRPPGLLEYLSGQNLVLLSNVEEPAFSRRVANKLRISALVSIANDKSVVGKKRKSGRLNRLGMPVQALPSRLTRDIHKKSKGTGVLAVALAGLSSSNVDVFGIEFYRTDYVSGSFQEVAGSEANALVAASSGIRDSFISVLEEFPDTTFKFFSDIDHGLSLPNLLATRIEPRLG